MGNFTAFHALSSPTTLVGEAFHMYRGWRLRQFKHLSNCPILEQQNRLFLLFLFFHRCLLCAWRLLPHLPSVFLVQNHHISFIFSPISYSSCCSTLDSAIEGQVKMLPTGFFTVSGMLLDHDVHVAVFSYSEMLLLTYQRSFDLKIWDSILWTHGQLAVLEKGGTFFGVRWEVFLLSLLLTYDFLEKLL